MTTTVTHRMRGARLGGSPKPTATDKRNYPTLPPDGRVPSVPPTRPLWGVAPAWGRPQPQAGQGVCTKQESKAFSREQISTSPEGRRATPCPPGSCLRVPEHELLPLRACPEWPESSLLLFLKADYWRPLISRGTASTDVGRGRPGSPRTNANPNANRGRGRSESQESVSLGFPPPCLPWSRLS